MKMQQVKLSEADEQTMLFNWAAYIPELKWMHHIPNGGSRNPVEAKNLKRQGTKRGVPDVFLPLPKGNYHGLYIEMKAGKNKLTDKQREFLDYANDNGYSAHVCYGHKEAIKVIENYLGK